MVEEVWVKIAELLHSLTESVFQKRFEWWKESMRKCGYWMVSYFKGDEQ